MYITEIELMKQKLEAVHKGNESELIKAIIADDMNSSIKKRNDGRRKILLLST